MSTNLPNSIVEKITIFTQISNLTMIIGKIENKLFPPIPEQAEAENTLPVCSIVLNKLDDCLVRLEKINDELEKL